MERQRALLDKQQAEEQKQRAEEQKQVEEQLVLLREAQERARAVFLDRFDTEAATDATIVALAPNEQVASKNVTKTLDILREQTIARGEKPLEYIELEAIISEINDLVEKMNQGKGLSVSEQARLAFVMDCLTFNPEYKAKLKKEDEERFEANAAYLEQCLVEMRGFVSPDMHTLSIDDLVSLGMSLDLAKRMTSKKCLRLVRMSASHIGKVHFADLNGQYSTSAQNLDVVEMCDVLASLPAKFEADENGKKEEVKQNLLREVKAMIKQMKDGKLEKFKQRAREYSKNVPLFSHVLELMEIDGVVGDPYAERNSFKLLGEVQSVEDKKAALQKSALWKSH